MTETTTTSAEAWRMNVQGFAPVDVVPDALILLTSTVSGSIEGDQPAVLVPYVGDGAAGFVAEGAVIPDADPTLGQVAIFTGKIAQLVKVSREQLSQDGASTLITNSMRRAVTNAANAAYLAQAAPVGPAVTPPAGLLNIAGITDGGAIAGDLDALVDAMAGIETAGGTPTHIIASPTAWASLSKFKAAVDSSAALLGSGASAVQRQLLDVPVLVSASMTSGGLLVVDKTAIVSAVGEIQLAQSDQAFFTSDTIAVRVTWRFGANVVAPARIVSMTVTAPA